jgi:hypothetical protein
LLESRRLLGVPGPYGRTPAFEIWIPQTLPPAFCTKYPSPGAQLEEIGRANQPRPTDCRLRKKIAKTAQLLPAAGPDSIPAHFFALGAEFSLQSHTLRRNKRALSPGKYVLNPASSGSDLHATHFNGFTYERNSAPFHPSKVQIPGCETVGQPNQIRLNGLHPKIPPKYSACNSVNPWSTL